MITLIMLKEAASFATKHKIRSITTKGDGRVLMNVFINGKYHYYQWDFATNAWHLEDPSLPVQLQLISTCTTKFDEYVRDPK